jgi:lia operon protein LiaG
MRNHAIAAPSPWPTLVAALSLPLLLVLLAVSARGADRYRVAGSNVHIHDIAGVVTVVPGTGPDVEVEVTREGRDAAQLRVEQGPIGLTQTLRVVFPSSHIIYPPMGHSHSTLSVGRDGRFKDVDMGFFFGQRVSISGTGHGLEAHADLRILVPAGHKVSVHLGAGKATASNVNGELLLDTGCAPVSVNGHHGKLKVDVGSGEVNVAQAEGDVDLDTGSGAVHVQNIRGVRLHIDTGSGEVTGGGVAVELLSVDTGSGAVMLTDLQAPQGEFDTGSGDVQLAYLKPLDRLNVDTGSGSVELKLHPSQGAMVDFESGSGDLDSGLPLKLLSHDDDHTRARIGDGRARIHVDTGSGDLSINGTVAAAPNSTSSRAR